MPDLIRFTRRLRQPVNRPRLAADAAFAVLVLALVIGVWPARLGGRALLVVVHGSSMEPTYHDGDLLYARTQENFEQGQAVVFRLPSGQGGAGQLVVHRIQGRTTDGRYITQGDNRPSHDGALPSAADLEARPMLNLGAIPVSALRLMPWTALLVIGLATGWYLWPHAPRNGDLATARPSRPAGIDLRGTWALVRDASTDQTNTPQSTYDDPFTIRRPLSLDDILTFMSDADHAAYPEPVTQGCPQRCETG